ncbi:hypothetical protein PENSPDRAFT_730628 [Peniophora sp. CONT]|nr:hypothetical protein PENSPDRAFT_730628 [Peniophora sp. CONT]
MLAVHPPLNSPYSHTVLSTATVREGLKAPSQQAEACAKCLASAATYECRAVRAEGLPVHLGHFRTTNYAVEISIDNNVQRTRHPQHGPKPKWNETLFESFANTSCKTYAPRADRGLEDPVPFGYRIMTWPLKCLEGFDKLIQSEIKIEVAFARAAPHSACTHGVVAEEPVTELDLARVEASLESEWKGLVKAAQTFMNAVKPFAEIHPYAALACKLLTYIPDQAAENLERDEQVKALCGVIKDALVFVNESEPLRRLHEDTYANQVQILARITHQITDCFRFLRTYADEACMWNGMIKHILTAAHVDKHVRHYKDVMEHLLSSFRDSALVQIQIRVHSIADHGDFLVAHTTTTDVHHVHSLLHPEKAHIRHGADHAHDVFEELSHWIEDPKHDATRAFLMVSASSDASAIAHEIAWRYKNMGRLASSFTFDAPAGRDGRSMYHSPQALIGSLSRDLANFDGHFKAAQRKVIANDPDIAVSADFSHLFEHLFLQPAKDVSIVGPVVVVIDGLHLGGTESERAALHTLLSSKLSLLPASFRVVLSMAPDEEIETILSPAVHKVSL